MNSIFKLLWLIKCHDQWNNCVIYAVTTEDVEMHVWNGKHCEDKDFARHICPAGTKVRIWMVSRFGDIGITDNLIDPVGYDARVEPYVLNNVTIKFKHDE